MSKTIGSHRGARRRFVCRRGARRVRGRRSRQCRRAASTARRSRRPRSTTGWLSPPPRARPPPAANVQSRSSPNRPTTRPASRTSKRPRQSPPRARSRRPRTLKSQCEQQYTALKQQVLGFLISSNWVIGEAAELGVKVSATRKSRSSSTKSRTSSSPRKPNSRNSSPASGQTVSDLLLRVKLNMLSPKIQQKVTKEASKKPTQKRRSQKYYNEHKSQYGQPEKRDVLIVLTKTEAAGQAGQEGNRIGQELRERRQGEFDRPDQQGRRRIELPGVVKGQEEKALNEAVFAAKQNVLGGPSRPPSATTSTKCEDASPGTQQTLAQVQSDDQAAADRRPEQQTALSTFVKEFNKTVEGAKPNAAAGYVVQDCKGYKAPKTSLDDWRPPRADSAASAAACRRRVATDEPDRASPRPPDPRQPRQPDGRGRGRAALRRPRPRGGALGRLDRRVRGHRAARRRRALGRQGRHPRGRQRQRRDRTRGRRAGRRRPARPRRRADRARRHAQQVAARRQRDPRRLARRRPRAGRRGGAAAVALSRAARPRACCRCR